MDEIVIFLNSSYYNNIMEFNEQNEGNISPNGSSDPTFIKKSATNPINELPKMPTRELNVQYAVLGYLIKNDKIMLIYKKRGIGDNQYNGVGGRVDPGETYEEALIREFGEEVGMIPLKFEERGELTFYNVKKKFIVVRVYIITEWEGEPKETEEAKAKWFDISAIPYDNMWEIDIQWLPRILEGKHITGNVFYEDIKAKKPKILENTVITEY